MSGRRTVQYRSLPAEPLLMFIDQFRERYGLSEEDLQDVARIQRQTIRRVRKRGRLTVFLADEIAAKLHCHPGEIWGREWFEVEPRRCDR